MKEIWKDIKGYEGLYQVSNLGRVKTLRKKVKRPYGFVEREEKILCLWRTSKGYNTVNLCKNHKHKVYLVHRLVAQEFIENPNNFPQINHKDENKINNTVSNLEWCTNRYNSLYSNNIEKMVNAKKKKREEK